MKEWIKDKIDKIINIATIREENRLLWKRVKELEDNQKPLIDLKNSYLSKLRVANLEIARLKKNN